MGKVEKTKNGVPRLDKTMRGWSKFDKYAV